jgi:hypothetical protein
MRVVPSWRLHLGRLGFLGEGLCGSWTQGGKGSSSDSGVEVGRWSGVTSTTSSMAGRGGMVQLSLGDECVWINERRAAVLFGAVAASTAGRPGKDDADLFPGDGSAVRWWWRLL